MTIKELINQSQDGDYYTFNQRENLYNQSRYDEQLKDLQDLKETIYSKLLFLQEIARKEKVSE